MEKHSSKKPSTLNVVIQLLLFLAGFALIIFLIRRNRKDSTSENSKQEQLPKKRKTTTSKISKRQKFLLENLKEKGKMTPSKIYALVPNISTRTVRRDMDILVKGNLVKQKGSTKSTIYVYIGE